MGRQFVATSIPRQAVQLRPKESFAVTKSLLSFGQLLVALALIASCARETLTDIDGNSYRTVRIGTQVWMAENLRVTHYRNGDSVPVVTDHAEWSKLTTGACCSYENDDAQVAELGLLYNWFAVGDNRQIAPAGWHVPTDSEWQILAECLGGIAEAGGKLKETGIGHWISPNTGATNEYGWAARPGGDRSGSGHFYDIGDNGYFWSSSTDSGDHVLSRGTRFEDATLLRYRSDREDGLSVRCVKD